MKLNPINATELTSYVIELLANRGITTVREFIDGDLDELAKITNLSKHTLEELRAKIHKIYRPKRLNVLSRYNELKSRRIAHGFDIQSCDEMLEDQKFSSGSVFEIYGAAGIGKTQLCLTVVLNIVSKLNAEALYIDTKHDFSATRLFEMLRARNINNTECGHIMQRIKVETILSLQAVIMTLTQLYELLESKSPEVTAIKLVVIDALPALWFIHNADQERFERKSLLCRIANLVHKIAQQYLISFLLVNLAVQSEDIFIDNAVPQNLHDDEINIDPAPNSRRSSANDEICHVNALKPTLGQYWIAVPRIRLLLKMPDGAEEDAIERIVEVTRNSFGPIGISCRVLIKDVGVIG